MRHLNVSDPLASLAVILKELNSLFTNYYGQRLACKQKNSGTMLCLQLMLAFSVQRDSETGGYYETPLQLTLIGYSNIII